MGLREDHNTPIIILEPRAAWAIMQEPRYSWVVVCRGRAVRASDFHTGGPRFEPRPGSSALGQGAVSSLPSLSEETLSRRSRV